MFFFFDFFDEYFIFCYFWDDFLLNWIASYQKKNWRLFLITIVFKLFYFKQKSHLSRKQQNNKKNHIQHKLPFRLFSVIFSCSDSLIFDFISTTTTIKWDSIELIWIFLFPKEYPASRNVKQNRKEFNLCQKSETYQRWP
jgi:hypothetical protein